MNRPEKSEYAPYFQHYIDLVAEGDFLKLLGENTESTIAFFSNMPTEMQNYRYAADKWTVKEVLMHVIDTERAFAYRAFVCARGDAETRLYGMDENFYNKNTDVTNRTIASLLGEFVAVRNNSVALLENINDAQSQFLGNTVPHKISARALGYLMIGHAAHHIDVIKTRYL